MNIVFFKVFWIEMHHKNVEIADSGDNVGVNIKGLNKDNMARVGDVMCIDDLKVDPEPPKPAKKICFFSICTRSSW
jgi:translation elongation factor EF-1alpha